MKRDNRKILKVYGRWKDVREIRNEQKEVE